MEGSVDDRKWDTWTRDEIVAARGYSAGSEPAPASAAVFVEQSAPEGEDGSQAPNGSVTSPGEPVAVMASEQPPATTNGSHTALQM
jgi:hypothetical protein